MHTHVDGLRRYLLGSDERANEDLVLSYFRHLFGEQFTRQADAKRADGYVAGKFVLELKGKQSDWHAGLIQGIAYGRELDFAVVVVAAKGFLAAWSIDDLPTELVSEARAGVGAPSDIGKRLAKKLAKERTAHLSAAAWRLTPELLDGLFDDSKQFEENVKALETFLETNERVRAKVTPRNFAGVLKSMAHFFEEPVRAIRAFYSILYAWDAGSRVEISTRKPDQAAVGGEVVTGLIADRREEFKQAVESYAIHLEVGESHDDFFSAYDRALDAVDPGFRKRHGMFFTDLDLCRFVLWLTKKQLGDVGKNYLVLDPACGSGNLVTNWRAPLELRHKVVSEIDPELLFAVERRMSLDSWHNGKFTVVPKVSEGKGLNFLDIGAERYLDIVTEHLKGQGHKANKPIAFLCNPPYRSDDDQTSDAVSYSVHDSIVELTGADAAAERYCCFLAQMKQICRAAEDSGLPGESLLLIFTKVGWMTDRAIFQKIRSEILSSFELERGVMVSGREFFDVSGAFPVAFTIWRYAGSSAKLRSDRPVVLEDLTWLRRSQLTSIKWKKPSECDEACEGLLADPRVRRVAFGVPRQKMREWCGVTSADFKRDRRLAERSGAVGGLPAGDRRSTNKKAYGQSAGAYIGFMDDLTPCRLAREDPQGRPWFRLDAPIMDCRKSRCLSGPPDQKGYCPTDEVSTRRLFIWFALQRTFADLRYPMWADAMDVWPPNVSAVIDASVHSMAFAIALADNECVETRFPANNPVKGAPALRIGNPMCPADPNSFWTTELHPHVSGRSAHPAAKRVLEAVENVYREWQKEFRARNELPVSYDSAYFIGRGSLGPFSGLLQIRHFAERMQRPALSEACSVVALRGSELRQAFHQLLLDEKGVAYFAAPRASDIVKARPTTSRKVDLKTQAGGRRR